jgi:replicative DNA helicase
MTSQRIPPQQLEGEMSILGAVLMDNDCFKIVTTLIDGEDFYKISHRLIFHAMSQCQISGTPIDLVTLSAVLRDNGTLDETGGGAYLYQLSDYVPTSANVAHYCRVVKEASVRRKMILYGQNLIEFGYANGHLDEKLKEAKGELAVLASGLDSFDGVNAKDILTIQDRAARYAVQAQKLDNSRFITGFPRLDYLIRGVAPGEVLTIIAEPGGFKTAWLQNLLLRGAKRTGLHHLFFSLEMPVEKVFEREAQISSGYVGREVERIYKGALGESRPQATELYKQMYCNGSKGLLVCDKPRLDIAKIARYTEIAEQKHGKINAIGIDYLGLMQAPGRSLFEKTAFIAPEFKHLAKELNLPVILLCQINREGAKNVHDILITDAKGGGDIEASADIMLGFYHDQNGVLVCKILKNRNGPKDVKLAVDINKEAFQFNDILEYEEPLVEKTKAVAVPRRKRDETDSYGGLPQ